MSAPYIRPVGEADHAAIAALNDLAFDGPDESRIVSALREDGDDLYALVAEQDGQIVGHIQFFPIALGAALEPGVMAGLGPMSVTPTLQKSGIGGALIKQGLAELKARGVHRVFVLGHTEYYPRFGFSVDATAGFAAPWGGPHFMAIELNANGPGFGQLIYPDAFSEG